MERIAMKYNDDMYFAHPVLRECSDDYITSLFECDFGDVYESGEMVKFDVRLSLGNPEMVKLINEGSAVSGVIITCLDTIQNRVCRVDIDNQEAIELPAGSFFGRVSLRPVIYTVKDIQKWNSVDLHEEFGSDIPLRNASLIAIGSEFRFSLDRKRLKPLESIFQMQESVETQEGEIEVDIDCPKISICVHPATKKALDEIRNDSRGSSVLLSSVYLPAVMAVLGELKAGSSHLEAHSWWRTLSAKCDSLGIVIKTCDPLKDAQRLLNLPVNSIINRREEIFN